MRTSGGGGGARSWRFAERAKRPCTAISGGHDVLNVVGCSSPETI